MFKVMLPVVGTLALMVGGTFLGFEGASWLPFVGAPQERVLVFLVGDREGVDRVRDAVDPARIVAATEDAIALEEGRIVAVSVEAVSDPYTAAGWIDREIEIFHVEKADLLKRGKSRGEAGGEMDPARLAKLQALIQKPTLTAGEQIFILQAMNDGIEF